MKKFFRWLFFLVFIGGLLYLAYIFFLAPSKNYQSIYLVPKNAVFIIETQDPIQAWDGIIKSDAWDHLKTNEFLSKLNEDLASVDSLIQSKHGLFKLLGSRNIILSMHEYANRKYDFLIVVDLKRAARLTTFTDYLGTLLGKDFQVTKRTYNGSEIFEIFDMKSEDIYYVSIIEEQAVISFNHKLIEAAIDQYSDPVIGRDISYIDVSKKIAGKNFFRIYIQYDYLDDYINSSLSKPDELVKTLSEALHYTGFSFDISDEGIISMEGQTNVNDTINSYFLALQNSGHGRLEIAEVIPKRVALYTGIGFDSFLSFYENFDASMKTDEEKYKEYTSSIRKIEKKLKINIKDNFISWVDDEIAIIQTQPAYLGKKNELAFILKAKDADEAAKNLDFISKQIKKNAPVKFKAIEYKGYPIKYLSLTGFFKLILGKLFAKLDKPYFTQIDRYVFFSNHPQTLKSIIDDYLKGETLNTSADYYRFSKNFNNSSNVFVYIQVPILYDNLKEWVSYETYTQKIKANKDYITSFPFVGFQMVNQNNMFETKIVAKFDTTFIVPELIEPGEHEYLEEGDTLTTETSLEDNIILDESLIILDDLSASEYKEYFENGELKLEAGVKNGLKHGSFKEYYENGELKIKGKFKEDQKTGTWRFFDVEGNEIGKEKYGDEEENVE